MDKAAEVEKSEQAVNWTAAAGIRTKGLFMLGYPAKPGNHRADQGLVRRIPMTIMNLTKFTPYPARDLSRSLRTNIRDDHWNA